MADEQDESQDTQQDTQTQEDQTQDKRDKKKPANKTDKKTAPKPPKVLLHVQALPDVEGVWRLRAILDSLDPTIIANRRVNFRVNNQLVVVNDEDDDFTGGDGVAQIYYTPQGNEPFELSASAYIPGVGEIKSREILDPSKLKKRVKPAIKIEELEVEDGYSRYYIGRLNSETRFTDPGLLHCVHRFPVSWKILRPLAQANGRQASMNAFDLDLKEGYVIVEIRSEVQGKQEIDIYPPEFPDNADEIIAYGPVQKPVPSFPSEVKVPGKVRFWDNCI